jgi:hypothetical protein
MSIYFRELGPDHARESFKICGGHRAAKLTFAATTPYWVDYSALWFQAGYDRLVVHAGRLNVVAVGPVFFAKDSEYQCNEPFCNLPEVCLVISPEVRATMMLAGGSAAALAVGGDLFQGKREDTFPFASGMVVSIGLEFGLGAPEDQEPGLRIQLPGSRRPR